MILAVIHLIISVILLVLLSIHLRNFIRVRTTLETIKTQVNHDLRSPLNAILGFSDLLLQTEKDNEKIKFLAAIKSGGESLLTILDELAQRLSKTNTAVRRSPFTPSPPGSELKSKTNLKNEREPLILIVDDMIENVVFLEKILSKSGFRTISAMSGDEALEVMTNYLPDLILLDIVMPGLSGFDTCAQIQSHKEFIDIPVIFLSAKKDEKTIIESFIYGGIDYVVKPFNSPELIARVNTHLQLKSAKEKLNILAFTDPLTGLFNRRKFMETLDREMTREKRYDGKLSFIMIDIDHFKKVNDDYGHDVGDKALMKFAEILSSSLRETDFAGRLGGEEFGVILPQTNIEQALIVAERIRSRIESESKTDEIPQFTASFGLAQYRKELDNSSMLTRDADKALYAAKEGGRNKISIFSAE
ncbi:MAG: diguanylate cyclase [Spirochaetales bacterium]|nr:diguanylate cyclase [Spirochaetales bacterium]